MKENYLSITFNYSIPFDNQSMCHPIDIMSADRSLDFEIQIFEGNNNSIFVENFVTLPRKRHVPLQPETIVFYIVFLVMLETVGNFLLYCIIVYEKYGMDTQKRTLTNQLLSMMILVQIFFNIFIIPIYVIYHIFGLHSKYDIRSFCFLNN